MTHHHNRHSLLFLAGLGLGAIRLACLLVLMLPTGLLAQTTIATGSIQGSIADPSGAVVPNARVIITNRDTKQTIVVQASGAGAYNSGALVPGIYLVRVEAKGFKTVEFDVTVQVGVTSSGSVTLQVGSESTVIQVTESEVRVNTEQATVQGVLTTDQIENLPVNGRNFLDLAQLEPGVQIQDGVNFDPTKTGYSSISFGGRFGRTARIEVDGVDVSDETVGTTTEDIPSSAISEFQLSQSDLDLSNELTSSGAVNVVTRTGSNTFHGEGFEFFRDSSIAAALPHPQGFAAPFQRSQFGGNFGGPILKDRLFFFTDAERTLQKLSVPVPVAPPFQALSGTFSSPFHESDFLGRLDYIAPHGVRMFYRFTLFQNKAFSGSSFFGASSSYSIFKNLDQTRQHVVGADFNTGPWTHSFRFSYLKFFNTIVDSTLGSSLPFANFPVSLTLGSDLATGPNYLAPQATPQSNHQIKYDGSRIHGTHIFRYGFDYDRLKGGGTAFFSAITANVTTSTGASEVAAAAASCPTAAVDPSTGFVTNPLCYPMDSVTYGNGEGYAAENPAFNFPFGELGPDNRIGLYVGDSWKARRNLSVTAGLRYVRDTGRVDSDLPAIPAVNAILPGLGNRIKQPNSDFAPQLGIAWDVRGDGKTVVRSGIGLFYENVIWNNELFDRPLRLPTGAFLQNPTPCFGGTAFPISFGPFGSLANTTPTIDSFFSNAGASICGESIGAAANQVAAFQAAYETSFGVNPKTLAQVTPLKPLPPNPSFLPTTLSQGLNVLLGAIAPGFKTPRSMQFNFGVQQELRPGLVLSVDYLRNVGTHYLLSIDANHSGDISHFDKAAGLAAVQSTLAACGVGTIAQAIAACPGLHPASGGMPVGGATMDDFASNGLDSASDVGGACQSAAVLGTATPCAFGGINQSIGTLPFLFPIGRSVYNAMQVKLVGTVKKPFPGTRSLNFQVSYALSRFTNVGAGVPVGFSEAAFIADQDFVNPAIDYRNPLKFPGDSLLDRRHQLSFGGTFQVPYGVKLSFISHFYSPLAASLVVPFTGDSFGEIFRTDFTGDGTVQDLLPGTNVGAFGRNANAGNLNNLLNAYNNSNGIGPCTGGLVKAGCPTPAGQLLISQLGFTLSQLRTLGAVAPTVPLAPPGEVNLGNLRAFDGKVAWSHSIWERLTVEPSVSFYNLFNFTNFDLPSSRLSGSLFGSPGAVNGTTQQSRLITQAGIGTGVYALGAPRQIEFGLKVSF